MPVIRTNGRGLPLSVIILIRKELTMKKVLLVFLILPVFLTAGWSIYPHTALADWDWRILKDLDLKASPLDVAASVDGKWIFILVPGEIVVFSNLDGTVAERIPVAKEFDRIAALLRPDLLTIASSTKKNLQILQIEPVLKIDISSLPFKGPEQAPVTVVVFDDYQ
jgi:hypothetical protein